MRRFAMRWWLRKRVGAAVLSLLMFPRWSLAEPPRGRDGWTSPRGWKVEQRVKGNLDAGVVGEVLVLVRPKADSAGEHPRMLLVLEEAPGGSRVEIGRSNALLLCVECFGALGGGPRVSMERSVLVIRQERGSRETVEGTWRFRREKQTGKMRLIGLDVRRRDRATGVGSSDSTNYLTGAHIHETLGYDPATDKDVVTKAEPSKVNAASLYLEDVIPSDME